MLTSENRSIVFEDLDLDPNVFERQLRIIHFNDVYNIEERDEEPVGGSARFWTALDELRKEGPALVVFSGDALSPSTSIHCYFYYLIFLLGYNLTLTYPFSRCIDYNFDSFFLN